MANGALTAADRLRDVVRLAADSWGRGRVTLHLRREPGAFELCATSDDQKGAGSVGPLRAGSPLAARVLASESAVVLTDDGRPDHVRLLMRVLGWGGDVLGILTFEQHVVSGEASVPGEGAAVQRIAALVGLVGQAVAAVEQTHELARANASLTARAGVDRRLLEVSQQGGGLSAMVRECAELTANSVTLFDHEGRQITTAHPGTPSSVRCPPLGEILASAGPILADRAEAVLVPAKGAGSLSRRKILAPVAAAGEAFGWLVLDEHPTGFRSLDRYVASRAAARLASELLVQRRVARMAWNAKSALARSMVRGTQVAADLMASAEYLGVNAGARRVLAYVLDASPATADETRDKALTSTLERKLGVEVLATRGSEGILLLIEAPAEHGSISIVHRVKAALESATAELSGPEVIVGISTVCEPTALSRGYREAREVVHCIERFARQSAQRVLAVDDLGPARLFLANSDTSAIRGYVVDILGPLLTSDPGMSDLLITLQCYFDASRSVRASAAALGVHENTIRLRLARVAVTTGLDVAGDANDQLSVQTALLVLRLQGHPILPGFAAHHHMRDGGHGPQPTGAPRREPDQAQRRTA